MQPDRIVQVDGEVTIVVVLVIVTERARVGHNPLAFYPRERQ